MRQALRMLARDWRAGELRVLAAALVIAVAGTSAMFIISRGAMLKKPALRSGSSVSTAATVNSARPSLTREPTGACSALTRRSSSHTVPGAGPRSAGASGMPGACVMRMRPRKG